MPIKIAASLRRGTLEPFRAAFSSAIGRSPRFARGAASLAIALGLSIAARTPSRVDAAPIQADEPAQKSDAPAVPEKLNFANGLLRAKQYAMAAEEYERYLKDDPRGSDADDARFGLAHARLFAGQYAEAKARFEAFLSAAPKHPRASTALYRLGEICYILGDMDGARRSLEAFTATNPDSPYQETAWTYLGDVRQRGEDFVGARRAYETSLAKFPNGRLADRARYGLARSLARLDKPAEALAILKTLALRPASEWTDRAWFQVGQIEADAGHWREAAAAFVSLEKASPKSELIARARLSRSEALERLGRREESEALLTGLSRDPSATIAANAALALGTSQLARGDAAAAYASLTAARARFSGASVRAGLSVRAAEAALKLGKVEEARGLLEEAAGGDPKDAVVADALLRSGLLAIERKDYEAAARFASRFLSANPKHARRGEADLIAGRADLELKQAPRAVKRLETALAQDEPTPAAKRALQYYLALAYRAAGRPAEAERLLKGLSEMPAAVVGAAGAASTSDAVSADALFVLAQGHLAAKRYAEAASALEKFLKARPEDAFASRAWAALVEAHLLAGKRDDPSAALEGYTHARSALDRFAVAHPRAIELAAARVRVGEAALSMKKYDAAATLFEVVAKEAAADAKVRARARLGLGLARLETGRANDAGPLLQTLLDESPDSDIAAEASFGLARAFAAEHKNERAAGQFERTWKTYPKTEAGRTSLLAFARLLADQKRPDDAARAFERYMIDYADASKSSDAPDERAAVLADWGWTLVDANRVADADRVFTRLLDQYPRAARAAEARLNLAETAFQRKQYDETARLLAAFEGAGSKSKTDPRIAAPSLYRLARARIEQRKWADAATTLDRLLRDYPEGPTRREAKFWRAECAFKLEDAKTAESMLAALTIDPPSASDPPGFKVAIARRRLECLISLSRWQDALKLADAILAEATGKPGSVGKGDATAQAGVAEVQYARGRSLQQLARFDEARAAYQSVIDARKQRGELAAKSQLMRGETFFLQEKFEDAVREFYKVWILYDEPRWQATAMFEAGKARERLGRWAEAAETYERLRADFPKDPSAAEALKRLEAARARAGSSSTPRTAERDPKP